MILIITFVGEHWPHFQLTTQNFGMPSQSDQIVQFIAHWATFQSLWQHFFAQITLIFCEVVKIFHLSSEIIFWATYIDIWQLFSCNTGCRAGTVEKCLQIEYGENLP